MKRKKGFLLYNDYYEHIKLLSNEEVGLLTIALFEYAESKKLPNFEGGLAMAFSFIRAQMGRDGEKYEETCRKREAAGKMGGRSKLGKANAFFAKQNVANEADNEVDAVNDVDTGIVNRLPKGPFSADGGDDKQ